MTNETTPASSLTDKEREVIAQMPYEEARDQLIQAVQALEAGGLNLDQSMRQWELGEALAKRAQSLLGEVRAKLDAAQAEQATTAVREMGDMSRPHNCASSTSLEGMLASSLTPLTSRALPANAPPRITSLSLVFAKSATTLAAAIASSEKP